MHSIARDVTMSRKECDKMFPGRSRNSLAEDIAHKLIQLEYRGFGDLEGALHRLATRTGISYQLWKRWWHRSSEGDVLPTQWEMLLAVWQMETRRQARLFAQEYKKVRKLNANSDPLLVRAALAASGVSETPTGKHGG